MVTRIEDDGRNLKELQDALLSTESVEQFLHEMSVLAAGLIGGGISCGMTMRPNGIPATVACNDQVAASMDGLQYELDDGPSLYAIRAGQIVLIDDTAGKTRWPEFESQAAAQGIRSCLALPLNAGGQPVGAISLYARTASAFGADQARRAENFAENASGALTLATRLASHAVLIDQLRSSLASRTVIDQALGIIMARERCTQSRAFGILRSASQNSNVKLREIAIEIVTSVTGEPVEPPPPFEDALCPDADAGPSTPVGVSAGRSAFGRRLDGPDRLGGTRQRGGDAGKTSSRRSIPVAADEKGSRGSQGRPAIAAGFRRSRAG
jgi:hypothetical protein